MAEMHFLFVIIPQLCCQEMKDKKITAPTPAQSIITLTRCCRQLRWINYHELVKDERYKLREDQWDRIKNYLPGKKEDAGCTALDNRRFIEAVMWISKTGAPWRDLPAEYGKWSNVHKRFSRWSQKGVWQAIFNTLASDADTEWLMLDSTIVRVHQYACGAKGGKKSTNRQVKGRQDQ